MKQSASKGGMHMACQGFNIVWPWPKKVLHLVNCTLSFVWHDMFPEKDEDFYDVSGWFPNIYRGDYNKKMPPIGRLLIHPKLTFRIIRDL